MVARTDSAPALRVLGVRIDRVRRGDAVARVAAAIETAPAGGPPLQVATINPEFVMRAQRDRAFARVLEAAGLCLPDGVGIVWAARLQGIHLERVTGVDLIEALAPVAARRGWSIFFLGAAPGVGQEAAAALQGRVPGLRVAGAWAGGPSSADDAESCARIKEARPDLLLVAYGAPGQDLWIARNLDAVGVPVAMGVGGALDFLAGRTRRAPRWVRRMGLEWGQRLLREPWRARRMLALPRFALAVLRERAAGRPPWPRSA
jgi:N-acetylglucosaminyldiphosphoundecaprenol N-acetyl-beta-D-mannosaminyltransferase